jgi:uncharacterized SAM-binding protein YcdF (DUF218 family)
VKPSPFVDRSGFRSSRRSSLSLVLSRIASAFGLFFLAIFFTPIIIWWADALSNPWESPKISGGTLIVLSAPGNTGDLLSDSSYWRAIYTARNWRTGKFSHVIVSGKPSAHEMATFLEAQGIPENAISIDDRSTDTHESALTIKAEAASLPAPLALVTSDFHVYRALRTFRKAGLDPVSLPHPDGIKRGQIQSWYKHLGVFTDLVAEFAAIIDYWRRGWI